MIAEDRVGRLHVLTDESLQTRFSHAELARLAARGGADTVQFREKRPRTTAELVAAARAMLEQLEPAGVRLVVNDRVDVAVAAGATAVHLGAHDLDPGVARRLIGRGATIGGTANDEREAVRVAATPVDYLGVGPVFGTRSKADPAPELGLAALERIVRAIDKPVIAIGNVTPDRVGDVLATGAHGIAVLSGIVCDPDPVRATGAFRAALDAWLRSRTGADAPRRQETR